MKKSDEYTPIHGLFRLLQATNNGAAEGTGVKLLVEQGHALLGPKLPAVMIDYTMGRQINLFGDYPKQKDMAPSIIFAVVFFVLALLHLLVFVMNTSRKHYFWLTLGFLLTCIMRVVGWCCRAYWSTDLTMVPPGIADEVFLIIPSILLVSFNLILAQRIFTWRHPVGGSRPLFWNTMFLLYGVVVLVIIMTIIASAVPYVYLLSEGAYTGYKKTVEASAILILLYTLTAVSLLGMAYFFKPTRKDENLYTYQPWWIESFSPFYFVKPGAKEEAEQSFMKRGHNHRHAIRVIAATQHHHNMVNGLSRERGDLKHNWSLMIITITTLFIFIGQVGRTVAVFQGRFQIDSGPVCEPVAMYICWGLFEVIIHLLYIIGRVDLRFYRPDRLPAPVRSIITAEQSLNPSDVETESMQSAEDDYSDSETQFNGSDDGFGFHNNHMEKERGDDESEFHF